MYRQLVWMGILLILLTGCEESGPKEIVTSYPSGAIRERYTVDAQGRNQGLYELFYEMGEAKATYNYHDGKKHGQCATFFKNGRTESNVFYQNDDPVGRAIFNYDSGLLRKEENYSDDSQLIWEKSYYPDGGLQEHVAYRTTTAKPCAYVRYNRNRQVIPRQSQFVSILRSGPYSFEAQLVHPDCMDYDSIVVHAVRNIHKLDRADMGIIRTSRYRRNPFHMKIEESDYAGYRLQYLVLGYGRDAEGKIVAHEFLVHWGKSETMPTDNIRPMLHD